jgi:hypothetical protein
MDQNYHHSAEVVGQKVVRKPLAPCGAILVYDVTIVENLVLLSREFTMLKIEDSGSTSKWLL